MGPFYNCGGQGGALSEVGETLHQVAVARDELDASVQHAFIDPLQELHSTELKDIKVWIRFKVFPGGKVRYNYMLFLFCWLSPASAEEDEWPSIGLGLQEEAKWKSTSGGGRAGLGQVHHV